MSELKPEAVAAVVSGKAMPADIFTGESLAKYFARKYLDMLAQRDMYLNAEISWEKAMMEAIGEDGVGSVTKAIAELKAQRDALAAEFAALKEFFSVGVGAAFEGCDWFGDDIQGKALELGLIREEVYSKESHFDSVFNPEDFEDGDVVFTINKTPATDAYLNSVRAAKDIGGENG